MTRTCDDVLSSSAKSKISSHLYLALEELKAKIKATKKSIVGKDVYMVIFSLTRVCIKMRIKDKDAPKKSQHEQQVYCIFVMQKVQDASSIL